MGGTRYVNLFRNGRIPVEFELPGDKAILRREGDRLVLEPTRKRGLLGLLEKMEPPIDAFPEIEDRPPEPEKIF